MMSYGALKSHLRGRLYRGQLNVPIVRNEWIPDRPFCYVQDGVESTMLQAHDHKFAKDYMLRTFYAQAPVPNALRLGSSHELLKIVDQEFDLMLNSGVTHIFRDVTNGAVAGLCLNCVWPVEAEYNAFDVNPTDWLNAAAELAQESAMSDPELKDDFSRNLHLVTIWRDLQYQLIYHTYQREAQRQGKQTILYQGMGYIEKAYRGRNVSLAGFTNLLQYLPQNCFVGNLTTFPSSDKIWGSQSPMRKLCESPYSDLRLNWFGPESKPVFGHLAGRGGIVFGGSRYRDERAAAKL